MSVVIIGAGHAGVQAAESLRSNGYDESIVLLDRDPHLPYQRPPLSKQYLKQDKDTEPLPLRGDGFFGNHDIDLRTGTEVTGIDTGARTVHSATGETFDYTKLILAVGAEARQTRCDGHQLRGISYLRTLHDAQRLRSLIDEGSARRVVVVGAGFIGLEFAAVAAERGLEVTVIDVAHRVMQRVLSPSMSSYFDHVHATLGVNLVLGDGLSRFDGVDGRVRAVVCTSGLTYPCDFAVVGLGVEPHSPLGLSTGLGTDRGVIVDTHLRTNDPNVYAIGDVALFPSLHLGDLLRLESVQNATDMAKSVAQTLTGTAAPYESTPWFWSTQGPAKLQIAGVADPGADVVERGDRAAGKFSQFLFHQGQLRAVESVNSPADHVAARKLIDHGVGLSPDQARDSSFDLKGFARSLPAG